MGRIEITYTYKNVYEWLVDRWYECIYSYNCTSVLWKMSTIKKVLQSRRGKRCIMDNKNCDPIWQNPPSDTLAEAPFAFKIVAILRLQSKEMDPWYKCPMVGFVGSGHNYRFHEFRELLNGESHFGCTNKGCNASVYTNSACTEIVFGSSVHRGHASINDREDWKPRYALAWNEKPTKSLIQGQIK